MQTNFLIIFGKILAIFVIAITISLGVTYYKWNKAKIFFNSALNYNIGKLDRMIYQEGYSANIKFPGIYYNSIFVLCNTHYEEAERAYDTVEYLLRQGADPEGSNYRGDNNLLAAIAFKKPKIAELLIKHGANINSIITKNGSFSFLIALKTRQYDLAQYLLDHGAYTNKELYERFKREQKEASLKKTK